MEAAVSYKLPFKNGTNIRRNCGQRLIDSHCVSCHPRRDWPNHTMSNSEHQTTKRPQQKYQVDFYGVIFESKIYFHGLVSRWVEHILCNKKITKVWTFDCDSMIFRELYQSQ